MRKRPFLREVLDELNVEPLSRHHLLRFETAATRAHVVDFALRAFEAETGMDYEAFIVRRRRAATTGVLRFDPTTASDLGSAAA